MSAPERRPDPITFFGRPAIEAAIRLAAASPEEATELLSGFEEIPEGAGAFLLGDLWAALALTSDDAARKARWYLGESERAFDERVREFRARTLGESDERG